MKLIGKDNGWRPIVSVELPEAAWLQVAAPGSFDSCEERSPELPKLKSKPQPKKGNGFGK
jgi:hypothetical protein